VASVNRHGTSSDGTIVPTLLDYLRVVGRRKLLFLLIVLLVPATAVAVSLNQEPTYRASAVVYLQPQALGAVSDPERVAQTKAELGRSPAVVDDVLDAVPGANLDREEFLESSSVSATLGRDILTFSVEHSDPQLARELATEYAAAFTEFQEQLDTQALANTLAEVRERIAEAEVNGEGPGSPNYDALKRQEENLMAAAASASQTRSAQVVNPADDAPKVSPRTVRNGVIAFCLGLLLAIIIVFLADALDTRVRSTDTIREALGLRLLGRLSAPPSRLRNGKGLVMLADPTSREAEQFRALRASLELANSEYGARALMITSAVDAEGKSTTAANLAVALARAGRRVVLIEGDVSDPQLHRLFNLDRRPGLTEVELGEAEFAEALRPIGLTDDLSGADESSRRLERAGSLEVLPGGSALQDPDELGFERAVGKIIKRVRSHADVVLVDAPPLLRGHAIALSAHVDALVVVVRLKALRTSALQDLSWMLEASPANKLGFVLTGVIDKSERYGQHQRHTGSSAKPTKPTLTVASSINGHGDAPAQARSKSAGRPFGGLSPREAAKRSAESRRTKSAQQAEAAKRASDDEAKDALEDA
jgi:succinoglycan biosynthesis transport protein ExoP